VNIIIWDGVTLGIEQDISLLFSGWFLAGAMLYGFTPLEQASFGWIYQTCLQGDMRFPGPET
jgi:hypothetical protein